MLYWMGQSGVVGYSRTVVVEWNKWSRVRRLDATITIITAINLFDFDIVDDGGLILFSLVFFGCIFYIGSRIVDEWG